MNEVTIDDEVLMDMSNYMRLRIAGLKVLMCAFGDRNIDQSKDYLDNEEWNKDEADIILNMTNREYKAYIETYPNSDYDMCEYMTIGTKFYRQLIMKGGMMLHASGVVYNGKAYLFSADSGTGKSTHTSIWMKNLKDKAFIINDDKPAIVNEDGKWFVYGTPWSGKTDMNVNAKAELGAIIFIERSDVNYIEKITAKEAVPLIFKQTVRKIIEERMDKLLWIMDKLLKEVRLYKLGCDISDEAFAVAFKELTGEDAHV